MIPGRSGPLRSFLVFVVSIATIAGVVALIGRAALAASAGEEAVRAWTWGCVVSAVASLFSGGLVSVGGRFELQSVTLALGSMLVRLAALVLVAAGAVVLLQLDPRRFLLGVAASYLALLVIDTAYALKIANDARRTAADGSAG